MVVLLGGDAAGESEDRRAQMRAKHPNGPNNPVLGIAPYLHDLGCTPTHIRVIGGTRHSQAVVYLLTVDRDGLVNLGVDPAVVPSLVLDEGPDSVATVVVKAANPRDRARLARELRILHLLGETVSPAARLPRVLSAKTDAPEIDLLVLDFVAGVDLFTCFVDEGVVPLTLDQAEHVALATSTWSTLQALHGARVAHRDFRLANLLVPSVAGGFDWNGVVALDLGFAFHPDVPLLREDGAQQPSSGHDTPGWEVPRRVAAAEERTFETEQALDVYMWAVNLYMAHHRIAPFAGREQAWLAAKPRDAKRMLGALDLSGMAEPVAFAVRLGLSHDPEARDATRISEALAPLAGGLVGMAAIEEAREAARQLDRRLGAAAASVEALQGELAERDRSLGEQASQAEVVRSLRAELREVGAQLEATVEALEDTTSTLVSERAAAQARAEGLALRLVDGEAAVARLEAEVGRLNGEAMAARAEARKLEGQIAEQRQARRAGPPGGTNSLLRLGVPVVALLLVLSGVLMLWASSADSPGSSSAAEPQVLRAENGDRFTSHRGAAPAPSAALHADSQSRVGSGGWSNSRYQVASFARSDGLGHFNTTIPSDGGCDTSGGQRYPIVEPVGDRVLTVEAAGSSRDLVARSATGGRVWRRSIIPGRCPYQEVVGNVVLASFVSGSGSLAALDLQTGRTIWHVDGARSKGGLAWLVSADIRDGWVYARGYQSVVRINLADGRMDWIAAAGPGRSVCDVAAASALSWVQTCGGALLRLDRETGRPVGAPLHLGDRAKGLIVAPNDMVYAIALERGGGIWTRTQAFDPKGRRRWEQDVREEGVLSSHAIVEGGGLYESLVYGSKVFTIEIRRASGLAQRMTSAGSDEQPVLGLDLVGGPGRELANVVTWKDDGKVWWSACTGAIVGRHGGYDGAPETCTDAHEGTALTQRDAEGRHWVAGSKDKKAGRL